MRNPTSVQINIHPAGYPFIVAFACVAALLTSISCLLGVAGWIATAWCIFFFRDPARMTPDREGLIIAPADGVISAIVEGPAPAELALPEGTYTRISTFLNVFDVHVNRFPIAGKVSAKNYIAGKFLNASLDKASTDNERLAITLDLADGKQIGVVQIAGLVARRIVSFIETGHNASAGERFGLIRFGSRVDVYLPQGIAPLVIIGQKMVAGETVMADLTSSEEQRTGTSN